MSDQPSSSSQSEESQAAKEYDRRVEAAAKAMKVKAEVVVEALRVLGIDCVDDAIEMLEDPAAAEKDANKVFCGEKGVKIVPFRRGWRILKGKETESDPQPQQPDGTQALVAALRPVEQYKDKELIEQYGPDCESRIAEELRKRTHDRRFVIFMPDGAV